MESRPRKYSTRTQLLYFGAIKFNRRNDDNNDDKNNNNNNNLVATARRRQMRLAKRMR